MQDTKVSIQKVGPGVLVVAEKIPGSLGGFK